MKVETDTILVTLSVILGMIATGFFIASGLFRSPVTDSLLVLTVGSIVLFLTYWTGQDTLIKGGQVIFSISLISSTLYVVTRFASGELLLSAIFAIFAILFLTSAYFYTREGSIVTEKRIMIFCGVLVVLFVITAGVDVASGTPSSQVNLNNNVTELEDSRYGGHVIGTIEVNNPSLLPQSYEYPRHKFCVTGLESENATDVPRPNARTVDYQERSTMVVGKTTSDVIIRHPFSDLEGTEIVRSEECPESTDEPTVHFLG